MEFITKAEMMDMVQFVHNYPPEQTNHEVIKDCIVLHFGSVSTWRRIDASRRKFIMRQMLDARENDYEFRAAVGAWASSPEYLNQ